MRVGGSTCRAVLSHTNDASGSVGSKGASPRSTVRRLLVLSELGRWGSSWVETTIDDEDDDDEEDEEEDEDDDDADADADDDEEEDVVE